MLNPLSQDAITAERKDHPQRPHYAAQTIEYPLKLLSDRQYELLVHDLLAAENHSEKRWKEIFLLPIGADRGRDIVLTDDAGVAVIVQCKRNAKALGADHVQAEVLKFCLNAARHPHIFPKGDGPRYQLWAAGGLTEGARTMFETSNSVANHFGGVSRVQVDAARKDYKGLKALEEDEEAESEALRVIALAKRLALTYFGPERINALIFKHDDVRRYHFRGPEDRPARASVDQVEGLAQSYRRDELALHRHDDPYVARKDLERHFEDFLSAESKAFILTGGSGQGKSTWAARLLAAPPPGFVADVISGVDILPSDQNFGETLYRKLTSGRTGSVPTGGLQQGIWDWLDSANRIVIIDGLDQVRADALSFLPGWLDTSLQLIRNVPTKLVLTSRLESWYNLSTQCRRLEGNLHHVPGNRRSVSMTLGAVTDDEREALYDAYGIDADRERGRKLTTPSLIRQLARLQSDVPDQVVTRLTVIDAEIEDIRRELRSYNVGAGTISLVFEQLAESLLEVTDGWIPLKKFIRANPNFQHSIDILVERDLALLQNTDFRIQSDDVIETLMSRALTEDAAVAGLTERRSDPLFIGAIALMIAKLEGSNPSASVDALRSVASGAVKPWHRLSVIFRTMLELQEPERCVEVLRTALLEWTGKNHLLWATDLQGFASQIALPTTTVLELLWPLAANEDPEDWRDSYWFSPIGTGRLFTAFARAMSEAVGRDPAGAIAGILERFGVGKNPIATVARFLLREAATGAPELALEKCWAMLESNEQGALSIVLQSVPGPGLRFLAKKYAQRPDLRHFLIRQAYHLATGDRPTPRPGRIDPDTIADAMDRMLLSEAKPDLRTLLLIARLSAKTDVEMQRELMESWRVIPRDVFWNGFEQLGTGRVDVFKEVVGHAEPFQPKNDLVLYFAPGKLFPGELTQFIAVFDVYRRNGDVEEKAVARAVEALLYITIDDAFDEAELKALDDFCALLAQSTNDATREELTYYAASRSEGNEPFDAARRDWLLDMLIENESGGNLNELCWKMAESWPARPDNLQRGLQLMERCGDEAVLEQLQGLSILPAVPAYLQALELAREGS